MSFFTKYKKALIPACSKCKLDKQCLSPNMPVTGEGKKGILIIGEAPGAEEDKQGKQWAGDSGDILNKTLNNYGMSLREDFWLINTVNCRPTKEGKKSNRTPTPKEIEYCRANIEKAIRDLKPTAIWLLGGTAITGYFGKVQSRISVQKYRGLRFLDKDNECWVYCTMHPSMLVRNKKDEYIATTFKRDIKWMASQDWLARPVYRDPYQHIQILTEYADVVAVLQQTLKDKPNVFFDYETTGLKPYLKGHKVASISFAVSEVEAYSFPYMYPHWTAKQFKRIKRLWVRILEDPKIPKAAQNLNFEDIWSRNIIGADIQGAVWDTLNTSHVIDDRHDITGLKWQLFQRYGVGDYGKELGDKLKAKDSNSFNRVMEIPLIPLLKYGCIDSLGGYWLWKDQEAEVKERALEKPNSFLFRGSRALTNSQDYGIATDEEYYDNIKKKISISKEAKLYKKKTGKVLDTASTDDLKALFFDVLKLESTHKTEKGNISLDADALESVNLPIAKRIVRCRKLTKVNDFAKLIRKESTYGLIHPFIHLNRARSYRSSSSNPNLQNMPNRNDFGRNMVRGGIIPRPGHRLGGNDYGGIEVCIAGCYTQDPTLINYINDSSTDMHRDSAAKIFKLPLKQITKQIRFVGKNGWVFAQFYGSWYKSCAKRMWVEVPLLKLVNGTPLLDHMKSKGIGTYEQFETYLKKVEWWFWDRFPVFRRWQTKVLNHYLKTGQVEMFTGFVRRGQLTPNKVINTAIQGTAFHCLLEANIILDEILYEEGWDTMVLGEIHDDIVSDIADNEMNEYLALQHDVMTKRVPDKYPWIIVPLTTEAELTGVDKAWNTIKEVTDIKCAECDSEWYFKGNKDKGKPHVCCRCNLKLVA